jgi:hypothetical protein
MWKNRSLNIPLLSFYIYIHTRKRHSKNSKKKISKSNESKKLVTSKQKPKKRSKSPDTSRAGKGLDHSPFFLVNLKDEVSQVIPITKNHYVVKKVDTNDRLL